jgi:glutathione S-transferase
MSALTLVGRSSSHFTRVARIFAAELGVPYQFRPVLDITSMDAKAYADNPALKVPALLDEQGSLVGTENICRELVRRSGDGSSVLLRGASPERIVLNAEELVLHAMASEVTLIMAAQQGGTRVPPKFMKSLENTLGYLDENVEAIVAALPADRTLSFVEVALFCLVTHFPFRGTLDVTPWARLGEFCRRFGERASARATEYRFDAAP